MKHHSQVSRLYITIFVTGFIATVSVCSFMEGKLTMDERMAHYKDVTLAQSLIDGEEAEMQVTR